MRARLGVLIAVALLAGQTAIAAVQPAEAGTVRGHVRLSSGGFIPPGSVELVHTSGIGGPIGHVSGGSEYEITDVAPGE